MIVKRYSRPPGSLDAGGHASDIFCTEEHTIAKQAAFVNRCAEMRFRWKAACFFARYDFLLGHLCIGQMVVHISVFFVGLECANDRDFCSRFGIVGRIAMLAREDEFQPLRCRGSRLQRPQSWLPFRRSSGRRGSSGSSPELPSKSAPRIKFFEEISGEIDHSRSIFRGFRPISEGSFFMRLYNKHGRK